MFLVFRKQMEQYAVRFAWLWSCKLTMSKVKCVSIIMSSKDINWIDAHIKDIIFTRTK